MQDPPITSRGYLVFTLLDSVPKAQHSDKVYNFFLNQLKVDESNDQLLKELRKCAARFCSDFHSKWEKSKRMKDRFISAHTEWLENAPSLPSVQTTQKSASASGRPRKPFSDLSERGRRARTEEIRKECSVPELVFATQMSLRSVGSNSAAKVLHATSHSQTNSQKCLESLASQSVVTPYTPDEALGLFIDLDMSKEDYKTLRAGSISNNNNTKDFYPSYEILVDAKKRCYPTENTMTITETVMEVQLQGLLDHTAQRIITLVESIPDSCDLILISKWGFDGTGGQSNYKMKFSDQEGDDSSLLITCLVPLQLYRQDPSSGRKIVLWQNSSPSSPRFCRPIRMQFKKETIEASKEEYIYVNSQIDNLAPSTARKGDITYKVTHTLLPTMVDGKVCNSLTGSFSQNCYICKAKPKEMNDIAQAVKRPVDPSTYKFGMSPLHCRMRCMETLTKIAYRQDLKIWAVTGEANKTVMLARKHMIQQEFKEKMGLNIDFVKQGAGTSNDGNTARRFFEDPKETARILGLDESLVTKIGVLLNAASSQHHVLADAFGDYGLEAANRYVDLYDWYHMPVTLHKLLIHGKDIIESSPLPIGLLTEGAIESRHKFTKYDREHHSRKLSREASNEDVLRRLLVCSDPVISTKRRAASKPKDGAPLCAEVLALLDIPASAQQSG